MEKENTENKDTQIVKTEQSTQNKFWAKTKKTLSYVFIDGLSGMAIGLFATLIIGTIIETIGDLICSAGASNIGNYFKVVGIIAKFLMGAGIGLGVGYKLKKPPLVTISAGVIGMLASFVTKIDVSSLTFSLQNAKTTVPMVGEPLTAFIGAFVALEVGSLVSGKTKVDIIVTPLVAIFAGAIITFIVGEPIGVFIAWLRELVKTAGEQQPFLMGVLVAVLMGVFLTLPISSAAIGVMLSLSGTIAGAAVVGCCCHMVGYAVMSFRENKWGGLIAQGLGTSMLQMPNLVKKPILWLPPIIASAILGPIASCALMMTSTPAGSGMGTAGLVGVIETFRDMAIINGENIAIVLLKIISIDIVAPAVLCLIISEIMRKFKIIKQGDLKLDL